MTFDEILKTPEFYLPLSHEGVGADSFKKLLFEKLHKFEKIITDSSDLTDEQPFSELTVKKRIQLLISKIKNAINEYYNGSPYKAYTELADGIKGSNMIGYWKKQKIQEGGNFFRMRMKLTNHNDNFERKQLFHVPFEERTKVSTQRYSIPGFPCLYLSNSMYVAWQEMGRPNVNDFHAVRLKNTQELNIIDLTTDVHTKNFSFQTRTKWDSLYEIMKWPLLAACSVKVKETSGHFKPEYIIPQLLLQWVREEKSVDGIKFSSTKIDLNSSKSQGIFYNIVLPVKDDNVSGFCSILSSKFRMTEPISWQLMQLSNPNTGLNVSDPYLKKGFPVISTANKIQ